MWQNGKNHMRTNFIPFLWFFSFVGAKNIKFQNPQIFIAEMFQNPQICFFIIFWL